MKKNELEVGMHVRPFRKTRGWRTSTSYPVGVCWGMAQAKGRDWLVVEYLDEDLVSLKDIDDHTPGGDNYAYTDFEVCDDNIQ